MHRCDSCVDVKKHIIVFFTFGVSLKTWDEVGILSREIALYTKLIDAGCDITFVTYGDETDLEIFADNIPITVKPIYQYTSKSKSKMLQVIKSVIAVHRMNIKDVDIIKTNQFWGSWLALYAKMLFKKPLLLRMGFEFNTFAAKQGRSPVFRTFVTKLSKLIYSCSDFVQVSSEADKNYLVAEFGLDSAKVLLRENYVDTALFCPKKVEIVRDVLVIGRLEEQKNIFVILQAISSLPLTLTIVGSGSLQELVRSEAAALGIDLVMVPKINNEDLPNVINSHKVFVIASHYEGNPKVLLEAMSCGALVYANESDGISSIVQEKSNGRFFHNIQELRNLLTKSDPEMVALKNSLGPMARELVKKNNSLDAVVKAELKTYSELTSYGHDY